MNRMKATVLTRFGGPEVLEFLDVEKPTFRADQMLVRVKACGVCGHDLLNREGHFPDTHPPCVMGHEIAGIVEEVGELVDAFRPGNRVALTQRISCGICPACQGGRDNLCRSGPGFYGEEISGGYGEFVVASPRNAVLLPEGIGLEMGAILSCAVGTGLHALNRARLLPGDTVVVTAASGGVGLHTTQLARTLGLIVIATTSSDRKADYLREAGAHHVIAAPDGQFHKAVRELTGGIGADSVIEIAGAPTFTSSLRSLAPGGRLVVVGNVRPGTVALNPALSILKEIEIVGSGHALVSDLRRVIDLVSRNLVQPRIAEIIPAENAARAHERVRARGGSGRIVLAHS
jgi:D-arabinose 1-dehydrogenase-like Zn-dependent alcohol dehydrogenase